MNQHAAAQLTRMRYKILIKFFLMAGAYCPKIPLLCWVIVSRLKIYEPTKIVDSVRGSVHK